MKKKRTGKNAGLAALALVAVLALTGITTTTASAANESTNTELGGEKYDDINTLNATVTVKNTILKGKKAKDGTYKAQTVKPSKVVVDGVTLKLNKNYTVSYQKWNNIKSYWYDVDNLTNAGTYRLVITGIGDYSGVATKRVYVYSSDVSVPASSIKISVNKMDYTGSPITEGVIKSVKYKNKTLVEGEDYTVTYLNNVDSGTGIVRIAGTGRTWYDSDTGKVVSPGFVGEKEVKFTIKGGAKLSKAKVTGLTPMTYDAGRPVTQDMSNVKLTYKNNELTYGTDYVVSYYMNNKKAGTAKIVFTGKGLYYGTVTKTFKINKAVLNENMLDKAARNIVMEYTQKAVKPEVTLYNSNGDRLVKGTDYTLSYKNNTKISDAAVIVVKGKGNYTGTLNVNFTIKDKDSVDDTEKEDDKPITDETTEPEDTTDDTENPETPETEDTESEGNEPGDEESEEAEFEEADDTESNEAESDEAKSESDEPIGVRVCYCGFRVDIYSTKGLSPAEKALWEDHVSRHAAHNETVTYTDRYNDGTKVEGTEGTETDGTESRDEESEDAADGTDSESIRPVGYVKCNICGRGINYYSAEGLSAAELEAWWDEHVIEYAVYHNGEDPDYTDCYHGDDPIAVRYCIGCRDKRIMKIYTYGLSDEENETWKAHTREHTARGEFCHWTSLSWDSVKHEARDYDDDRWL